MCGIAGFISNNGLSAGQFLDSVNTIRHRGPDDEGFVLFDNEYNVEILGGADTPENVFKSAIPYCPSEPVSDLSRNYKAGLAHRRLSIIDTSENGHLPMQTREGKYWITYNGEIYNYIELRKELESAGVSFTTHTDTEVALQALQHWGLEAFNRFRGMWAIALLDIQNRKLILCRDRFGIKPLYYFQTDSNFYFGSEIKQFTGLAKNGFHLNKERAFDFLNYSISDHTRETLFKDVFQVLPGTYMEVDFAPKAENEITFGEVTWYELEKEVQEVSGTEDSIYSEFRERFLSTLQQHLRSDVPIGSCLSGGLDSSIIVGTTNEILEQATQGDYKQKTFSAYSTDERYNEKKWVETVTRDTKIESFHVYPEMSEAFANLDRLIYQQDEPFQSSSIFMQWKVFELASKNGVTVMLDGQGADEQLAGYSGFVSYFLAGIFSKLKFLRAFHEMKSIREIQSIPYLSQLIGAAKAIIPASWKKSVGLSHFESGLNKSYFQSTSLRHPYSSLYSGPPGLRSESIRQLSGGNLQRLLHWEDRNSMAFSIEARVPYLDHQLVEYSVGLSDELKIKNGFTKFVLRKASEGWIPELIRWRKDKIGFASPEEQFVRANPDQIREYLSNAIQNLPAIFSQELISEFDNMLNGSSGYSNKFWRVIAFHRWVNRFKILV